MSVVVEFRAFGNGFEPTNAERDTDGFLAFVPLPDVEHKLARARVVEMCRDQRLPLARRQSRRDQHLAATLTIFAVSETDFAWLVMGLAGEVFLDRRIGGI
jgi:hypothetical protein